MDDIIRQVYYDPKTGFTSLNKFYRTVKEKNPRITLQQVKSFLDKQETYQVNREDKKPKTFTSIYAPKPFYNFQIDIIIYDRFEIDNYKYILCVVDTYSRYAVCKALTNRENPTIVKTIDDIFKEMGGVPERVNCDNEFNTTLINNFWKKNNIRVYYSDPEEINKNSIVERFNRTLITLLQKFRTATQGRRKWYKYLSDLADNYNNNIHSTIKEKPKEVFDGKVKSRQIINVVDYTPFENGEKVRIRIIKKVFDKGSEINYSNEVYTVRRKEGNKYFLKDEDGNDLSKGYKPYELRRASEIQFNDYTEGNDGDPTIPKEKSQEKIKRAVKKALKELKAYTTASEKYNEKERITGRRQPKARDILDL